jgi:hypothetical protein
VLSIIDGRGACIVMVADCTEVPPGPVHVIVNVVFAFRSAVRCAPEVALEPDHPPEPVQLVAFEVLHRRTDGWPLQTTMGVALSTTLGGEAAKEDSPYVDRLRTARSPNAARLIFLDKVLLGELLWLRATWVRVGV